MDLDRLIKRLQAERTKLDDIIRSLEQLQAAVIANPPRMKNGRGRKFMGEDERQQVAIRMTNYWATRRQLRNAPQSQLIMAAAAGTAAAGTDVVQEMSGCQEALTAPSAWPTSF
jgi:hypothetical protein